MTSGHHHGGRHRLPEESDEELLAEMMVLAEGEEMGDDLGAIDVAPGVLDRFAPVRRFDEVVDGSFDALRGNPVADRAFYAVTELGDFGLVWLLIGALRGLRSDQDADEFLRLAVAMGIESTAINMGLKSLFKRERPVVQVPRPHKLRIPLTTSFPSGHATSAMVAATLLSEGRRTGPLYYGLGLWVASSRVYVKIHHASDVAAGLVIGLTLGKAIQRVWPGPRSPRRRPR